MPSTPPPHSPDALQATLERALAHVTPEVDAHAVTVAVERRRAAQHRSARRRVRVRVVAASAVATAACLLGVALVRHEPADRVDSTRAADAAGRATTPADPSAVATTSPTIVAGQLGTATEVPGRGSRIIGLGAPDQDGFWIARGDPLDATDPVETTISRIGRDGTADPYAEIVGVPLLGTVAGDELWIVAEDRVVTATDPTRFRLKRIDRTTGEVLGSTPLQMEDPLGLRVVDGRVTLVGRSGMVTFDASGEVVGSVDRAAVPRTVAQVLHADGLIWVRTESDGVIVTSTGELGGAAAEAPLTLADSGALVAAQAWGPGAVATTVRATGGLDLVQLAVPDTTATGAWTVPSLRTRLTGLPEDTELVDVRADHVWVLRGDRLAAVPLT